jgi:hypothetical protein
MWEFPVEDLSSKLLLFRNITPFVHPGVMYRRDVALDVGGYDEELCFAQDRDLWWKLSSRGAFHNSSETLICYRRHGSSITASRSNEQVVIAYELTRKYAKRWRLDCHQIACFSQVEESAARYQSDGLTVEDFVTYVATLKQILDLAPSLWNVSVEGLERLRRQRWNYLFWWVLQNRLGPRERLVCLRCLYQLSPSELSAIGMVTRLRRRALG